MNAANQHTTSLALNPRSLAGYFRTLGLFFLAFGIIANVLLYLTFSDNWLYKLIYGSIGAGLDLWKAGALLLALMLWFKGHHLLAILAGFMFFVLTSISIGAGFGFTQQMLAEYEKQRILESSAWETSKSKVERAIEKVEELSEYAGLDAEGLRTEHTALLTAPAINMHGQPAGTVAGNVGNCSGSGYYVSKHCPAILALERKIRGAEAYAGAVELQRQAQDELSQTEGGAQSVAHPMFVGLAKLFSTDPQTAKYGFFMVSILTVELGSVSTKVPKVSQDLLRPTRLLSAHF